MKRISSSQINVNYDSECTNYCELNIEFKPLWTKSWDHKPTWTKPPGAQEILNNVSSSQLNTGFTRHFEGYNKFPSKCERVLRNGSPDIVSCVNSSQLRYCEPYLIHSSQKRTCELYLRNSFHEIVNYILWSCTLHDICEVEGLLSSQLPMNYNLSSPTIVNYHFEFTTHLELNLRWGSKLIVKSKL